MFETIVWATDGSELADRALQPVIDLARMHHSKVVAVHANELLKGRFGGAPLLSDEPELIAKIEGQVVGLREIGLPAELKIVNGTHEVPMLIAEAAIPGCVTTSALLPLREEEPEPVTTHLRTLAAAGEQRAWRGLLLQNLARFDTRLESGDFPPTPGEHCTQCELSALCGRPVDVTVESDVEDD